MTLGTALRQGTELLAKGGIGAPRLTAEVLLAHAVHRDRTYLYAHPEKELREVEWIHFGRYLHERLKGKPTQYITQVQDFYGRPFYVDASVLIPRPETEHLIEAALPLAANAGVAIDVGTGSGSIAITLALETDSPVIAVDVSNPALTVARRNAARLQAGVAFILADLLSAFNNESAGLIVSNPPYVAEADRSTLQREVAEWEPELALFAGPDGLAFYRRLIPEAARVLRPGGHLIVEIGSGQSAEVAALFGPEWGPPQVTFDLAGIARVLRIEKMEPIDRAPAM